MKSFLVLCATLILPMISHAQTDTLVWDDDITLTFTNASDQNPCNHFEVGYMEQMREDDSVAYFRAVISQKKSWLCPAFDDGAETELAYYIFSLTELWSRKLNNYLKDNNMLPAEYRRAYLEDSWEKHLKYLTLEMNRFGHGEDTSGLSRELTRTIESIFSTESVFEDSKETYFGYGMDFFASTAYSSSNIFSKPVGMGISLQFFAKNTGIAMQGNIMYGTTEETPASSTILSKGQRLQHGHFTMHLEQRIIDNNYVTVAPYVGYGYYEIQAVDSLRGSVQVEKSAARISSFSPTLGITCDYKLRGQMFSTERRYGQDSYWLIRAGIGYTPYIDADGKTVDFWTIKIGLGGFSKFWN